VTLGAFQTENAGGSDVFLVKIALRLDEDNHDDDGGGDD
jgi:hypothetical protein